MIRVAVAVENSYDPFFDMHSVDTLLNITGV